MFSLVSVWSVEHYVGQEDDILTVGVSPVLRTDRVRGERSRNTESSDSEQSSPTILSMEDGQTMQGWSTAVTNRWRESIETYIDKAFEGIAEMVEGGQSRVQSGCDTRGDSGD